MPSLELFYFDIPGKGEAIRLAAAHAKLDLEDVRVTRERFLEMKKSGELKYGQMPALRVDGKTIINQSGLNVITADNLDDAAQKIVKAVQG